MRSAFPLEGSRSFSTGGGSFSTGGGSFSTGGGGVPDSSPDSFLIRSIVPFVCDSFCFHDSFLIRSKLPIRIDPKMLSMAQKDS
jgi:hypothetical protein